MSIITRMSTVLAGFTLLALPAAADSLRDLDVGAGVQVMLSTRGAVQQVLQVLRRNLRYLNKSVQLVICLKS